MARIKLDDLIKYVEVIQAPGGTWNNELANIETQLKEIANLLK